MTTLALDHYRLLGASGLRVSPFALGTMTFGADWGWGADESDARRMFDLYLSRGGNFVDTAVNYTNGASEKLLGRFLKGQRDRVVLASKFTMSRDVSNPNAGGNHRLNLLRSVEQSLSQLDTDRIDVLFLHAWDMTTGVDEVARALDDLVRSGKVMYLGISNTPAWRVAQLQTLATLRGLSPLIALQIEWSLVERSVEEELVPMAEALGLGVLPWSPLAGGVLTGKYGASDIVRDGGADVSPTRKGVIASQGHLNARAIALGALVRELADSLGATPSQVALAWLLTQPTVTAPILGARTVAQLEDNLGALSLTLPPEALRRLDTESAMPPTYPRRFMERGMVQKLIFGQTQVETRRSGVLR